MPQYHQYYSYRAFFVVVTLDSYWPVCPCFLKFVSFSFRHKRRRWSLSALTPALTPNTSTRAPLWPCRHVFSRDDWWPGQGRGPWPGRYRWWWRWCYLIHIIRTREDIMFELRHRIIKRSHIWTSIILDFVLTLYTWSLFHDSIQLTLLPLYSTN